jgi:glycosyltransferase involved in cell wall biosynthesis
MEYQKICRDFSIITPVYNGEKWISETVNSVLEICDGFSFEYIVVNDGSSDNTLENLSKFANQIKVIDQKNHGEAESVNIGLRAAQGKYILVVSADDPMRSSKLLSSAKEILEQDPSVVCVYPSWSVIDTHSQILRNVDVVDFSERDLIGQHKCIVGPGGVFRRETALAINGRRTNLKFTSDYDFWLRLSRQGNFRRVPGYLAYWREHESSTSIAFRGEAMANERISVIQEFLAENAHLPKRLKRMAISSAYYQAALLVYFDPDIPSKKFFFRAVYCYPMNVFSFDWKIMLYIVLAPISTILLKLLKQLGLFRKLPHSA